MHTVIQSITWKSPGQLALGQQANWLWIYKNKWQKKNRNFLNEFLNIEGWFMLNIETVTLQNISGTWCCGKVNVVQHLKEKVNNYFDLVYKNIIFNGDEYCSIIYFIMLHIKMLHQWKLLF